jgi:hypothetical protein
MEEGGLPGFIGNLIGAAIISGVIIAMGFIIIAFMLAGA